MVTYVDSPTVLPPLYSEALSLASAHMEVEALCLASSSSTPHLEEHAPGFRTRRFRVRSRSLFHALFGKGTTHGVVAAVQYVLSYVEYVAKALAFALRSRAHLYEAHDLPSLLPALLAAKLRGRPIVYRAHELWPETHARVRFAWLWRWLDRALVPHCDEVVTPEENRSRIYLEECGAKRMPLTVRNCPPYRSPIESTKLRDELARGGVAASTIVLYQGLIDSMRCIEEIAEATRYFDEGVSLVIMGSGFGKWADAASVLAEHERVVVLPKVLYEELPPYTASADVGILLYRNDCRNNFYCAPNKLFEYLMMGLPVIAPAFPGMVRLVEGEGVGLCVDPESPRAIAEAVNRMARDVEGRRRMKAKGLRLSRERCNWEAEFRPLLQRYRDLLGGNAPAAPR